MADRYEQYLNKLRTEAALQGYKPSTIKAHVTIHTHLWAKFRECAKRKKIRPIHALGEAIYCWLEQQGCLESDK